MYIEEYNSSLFYRVFSDFLFCIILGLSLLEGRNQEELVEEWKIKVLPTYLLGAVVWIPAQIINFKLISPQFRVAYVASFVLLEVNVLCVFKRLSPESLSNVLLEYFESNNKGNNADFKEPVSITEPRSADDTECMSAVTRKEAIQGEEKPKESIK